MGEAGSRLGVRSKSLHLIRSTASFRSLGATGKGQVNASQGNQTSEGYPSLTLAGRQPHSSERCHLTTAHDNIDGGRGTTRHNLAKCGRHPKILQVLAQVGRGSLTTIPDATGWCRKRPPQLGRGGGRLGYHRGGSVDDQCWHKWAGGP